MGSEVFLRIDILSKDNLDTMNLLRASKNTLGIEEHPDVGEYKCRRNMVGSLPRGMPKVVDYRQIDA